jgi:hypothetical protein
MATQYIKFKRSSVPGKRPSISQIELGELALNTYDGRIFTKQENVGIGTTVTLLNVWTENIGGGAYYNDGFVGIGTTNPTSKLHIVGNVLVSGVVTASNFFKGSTPVITGIGIGSTSINPGSGSITGRVGYGFTDINIVGVGVSVVGYGSTLVLDFNTIASARVVNTFTATEGQTIFNVTHNPGFVDVYVNGVRLATTEFVATNGTTVLLNESASAGDNVSIITYQSVVGGSPIVTPGGSNTQLQFNDSGAFNGDSGLTYNKTTKNLNVTGFVTASTFSGNLQNTLTLNTSGTGLSGSTTFNNSGASTFTVTSNATSANTNSTIVSRDGSGGFVAGIVTATFVGNLTGNLNSSGVNTATTISGTTLNYNVGTITNLSGTNVSYSGIGTVGSLNIGSTQVISSGRQLQNVASLDATTTATIETAIANAPNTFTDLQVTGISTFVNGPVFIGSGTSTGTATQRLQVTGGAYVSGDIGIGVTRPVAKLDVNGDVAIASTVGIGTIIDIIPYDTLNNGTLSFEGSAGQLFSITNNLTSGSIFSVNDVSGIPSIDVDADGTVSIASFGGNLGVGTTSPTSKLHIIGDVLVSGIITSTDYNSASDIKLKENIQAIENPIDKILNINGVSFDWKETGKSSMGVIAQDVEKVLPELVNGTDSKTVNYNGLIGLLIEVVKEQQKEINILKERLS